MPVRPALLIARIRARRATRPTMRRVPKQAHPLNIEREYARTLDGMMSTINEMVKAAILPGLKDAQLVNHHDATGSTYTLIPKLNAIKVQVARKFTAASAGLVAQGVGVRTSKFNRVAIGDQIKAVIGVDPLSTVETLTPGIIDDFVAENVSLIQSIPERYFSEVNGIVSEAVSKGTRASDVSAAIQARYSVSQSRASLIARDQVSKLNGKLTETRQKGLGINRYTWRTSLDECVRDTHQALEGTSHSWDSPPSVGHPGEDFQCRCRAEPDLSALLGD